MRTHRKLAALWLAGQHGRNFTRRCGDAESAEVLKGRLAKEGGQLVTSCYQFKLPAGDGKMRLTDVANAETLLRLVQSVPSPKAEPIKLWLWI